MTPLYQKEFSGMGRDELEFSLVRARTDLREMHTTLSIAQARCTQLLEEARLTTRRRLVYLETLRSVYQCLKKGKISAALTFIVSNAPDATENITDSVSGVGSQ